MGWGQRINRGLSLYTVLTRDKKVTEEVGRRKGAKSYTQVGLTLLPKVDFGMSVDLNG